jgi:predicted aconitase with swiveling domain
MSLQINCRKIVGGYGIGKALVTRQPINFLAMLDTQAGTIIDRNHELFGQSVKNVILVFPNAVGSSVGAYSIYSLRVNGVAPTAIVCTNKADITTASGCAISSIPVVDMLEKTLSCMLSSQMNISVDADNGILAVI